MNTATILIIESNGELLDFLCRAFSSRGYQACPCPSPDLAETMFRTARPDLVLLDIDLFGNNAWRLMDLWREERPRTRVVVQSETADAPTLRESMEHGATAFLIKPYTLDPLFELIEKNGPPFSALRRRSAA